jgi:hypothetical protein
MKGAALHLIDLAALTSSEVQLAKRALGNHRECNVIRPILHGPVYDEAIFGQIGLNVAMRWEDPMLDLELIQINKLRDIGKTWYLILFIESAQPIVLEVLPNSSPIDAPFGSLHLRWPDDSAIDLLIQLQSQPTLPPIPIAISIGNYLLLERASPAL